MTANNALQECSLMEQGFPNSDKSKTKELLFSFLTSSFILHNE